MRFDIVNKELPIDYICSTGSQAIVVENCIYTLGKFLQESGSDMKECLDTDFVLKIDNEKVQICRILLSNSNNNF